ncbi:MAG TPA: hypothetical protein VK797_12375 [Tepidisphaeraceae bacterium]|nr:hypothetical protein [Tepidisphaeraceae bacterium]
MARRDRQRLGAQLIEPRFDPAMAFRARRDDQKAGKLVNVADRSAVVSPAIRLDGVFDRLREARGSEKKELDTRVGGLRTG